MYAAVALQPLEQVEIILEIDLGRIGVSGAARDLRTGWRGCYSLTNHIIYPNSCKGVTLYSSV